MGTELAALFFSMSLLPNGIFFPHIKDRQLQSFANLCSHTAKTSAARSENSAMLQHQILRT